MIFQWVEMVMMCFQRVLAMIVLIFSLLIPSLHHSNIFELWGVGISGSIEAARSPI